MLEQLNKGISTPIAISIILILAIILGSFTWWQYTEIEKERTDLPELKISEKKCSDKDPDICNKKCNSDDDCALCGCSFCVSGPCFSEIECERPPDWDCQCIDNICDYEYIGEDKTADWKTYTNKKYGFKMKYPKEWIRKKDAFIVEYYPTQEEEYHLFFDTQIDRENRNVIVYLYMEDRRSACPYDELIFSNGTKMYDFKGGSWPQWFITGKKDECIGVYSAVHTEGDCQGLGCPNRIEDDLRLELRDLILTMLGSIDFE